MQKNLKKAAAVILSVIMLLSALPFAASAAIDTSSFAVLSVNTDKPLKGLRWNESITYTVVTRPGATRVKIAYPNGEIYELADSEQGFSAYSDSSTSRTWTITKRNQLIGEKTLRVFAGTSAAYDSEFAELSCGPWEEDAVFICTACDAHYSYGEHHNCSVNPDPVDPDPEHNEPPYPFWKDYINYSVNGTMVYYYGKIYQNKWYVNAGALPTEDPAWELVGDAEWTVPEDPANYTKSEGGDEASINKVLTDAEIETLWGGINEEYSEEAALGRLEELIPQSSYESLFPYRFGCDLWKSTHSAKEHYPDMTGITDYYSYENLKKAMRQLANIIIKVEWYDKSAWCYRITRLDKTTHEQKLVYSDDEFGADYLETSNSRREAICDYGSFIAEGDLRTRKKELAAFLANISHETGGGSVDGGVDEMESGLFFNEEVGFINSQTPQYVQPTGTKYLPVEGKSYHGRGPIQLSYNYNYGLCSDVMYGDPAVLLEDPDKVDREGDVGFMTGIWFWMTPQPPKPSCHQVITATWQPGEGATNAQYNGQFGLTIVIINNESNQSENNANGAVPRRCKYFRRFCNTMGVDLGNEQVDTIGMTSFVQS